MIHHSYSGNKGEALRLVMTNNTTASSGVVHARGYTLSRPSRVLVELIPLRILLTCGIVRADLASR
jgi:hypothetical protein